MSKIVIYKENLINNLQIITDHVKKKDKIAAVLKDNAYGHGLVEIATICSEFGIKRAVVRRLKEAESIKSMFNEVIVLGELPHNHLLDKKISFAINSLSDIDRLPKASTLHLKVDTGMHRNGIDSDRLEEALEKIVSHNHTLQGVFTHIKEGDELSSALFWQKKNFSTIKSMVVEFCNAKSISRPLFHSLNSSGLFRTKDLEDDFARVGIAMYGYLEWDEIFGQKGLKPVMELRANKIATRRLKKGARIGYGGVYRADREMVVTSYDVGYGDGFFRASENVRASIEDGREILGRVSMDYLSLEGDDDEVILFKDAKRFAKQFNTISYDVTTKLSPTIKREVV